MLSENVRSHFFAEDFQDQRMSDLRYFALHQFVPQKSSERGILRAILDRELIITHDHYPSNRFNNQLTYLLSANSLHVIRW